MSCYYQLPAQSLQREIEIKKSRFIARAGMVSSKEEAKAFVAQARSDYPDARHHCWAYLIGNPHVASSASANDDGEPSGTAGKPILNVIQHKNIGDVIVVVIRYFGGIKLGAGGLSRAYSAATEAVLAELPLVQQQPQTVCTLMFDFALEQSLRHWLENHHGDILDLKYDQQVSMRIRVEDQYLESLKIFCAAQNIHGISSE